MGDFQEGQRPLSFNRSVSGERCCRSFLSEWMPRQLIGPPQGVLLSVHTHTHTLPSLSGHEFPFSIQMSHVIQSLSQRGESRDAAAPPVNRQVALQMEQLQADKLCQFVLKPRPTDALASPAGQLHVRVLPFPKRGAKTTSIVAWSSELPQKPLKRRRSFIGWAFWRASSSHLDEPSLGPARGCLFGQPLSSVCMEDALPKPVMVSRSESKYWTQVFFFFFFYSPGSC